MKSVFSLVLAVLRLTLPFRTAGATFSLLSSASVAAFVAPVGDCMHTPLIDLDVIQGRSDTLMLKGMMRRGHDPTNLSWTMTQQRDTAGATT